MNTAQRIIAKKDWTGREKNDMINFMQKRFERVSYDMYQYWFKDGSSLLVQNDQNLHPVEMIEV